jgi:hypothetical protein
VLVKGYGEVRPLRMMKAARRGVMVVSINLVVVSSAWLICAGWSS